MSIDPSGDRKWAGRWDQIFEALSSEPRRTIIISLVDKPAGRRLPLPEAAESPNQSMDSEMLSNQLRHRHLPLLADAGYIRWTSDPFCVQRGPAFAEVAFITNNILNSIDEIPHGLIENCKLISEMAENDSD